ncbi:MAG: hypothetical protein SGPRY_012719, partial [Prymnesium sp.]
VLVTYVIFTQARLRADHLHRAALAIRGMRSDDEGSLSPRKGGEGSPALLRWIGEGLRAISDDRCASEAMGSLLASRRVWTLGRCWLAWQAV